MAREKVFTLCTLSMLMPASTWAQSVQDKDENRVIRADFALSDESTSFRQPEYAQNHLQAASVRDFTEQDIDLKNDVLADFVHRHADLSHETETDNASEYVDFTHQDIDFKDDVLVDFIQQNTHDVAQSNSDDATQDVVDYVNQDIDLKNDVLDFIDQNTNVKENVAEATPRRATWLATNTHTVLAHNQPPTADTIPLVQPENDFDITQSQQRKIHQKTEQNQNIDQKKTNAQPLQLSKEELLQQPELLYRALSSSVLLRDVEGVRLLLPVYQKLPQPHDELLIKLSQAMIARADGQAGDAVEWYQQALRIQPNMPLIRLNLAQSLYEDHQNREAEKAFEAIQAEPDLPENVKELTDSYLKILKKRRKWRVYASANYTRDNNVNNAPKERVLKTRNGAWHLPEPESAQGFAYRAGIGKDTPVYRNYVFRTNVDLWGKFYWDNHDFDDLTTRASAGVAFQNARSEMAVLPYYDRRWYGGKKYSTEKGVRAEYSRWLSSNHQALFAGEVGREVYDKRKFLNGRTSNLSATWLYVPKSSNYFTLGVDVSRKSAQDRSDAYRRQAVRASWSQSWGQTGFTTLLTANYGQREYDARDFFNIVRKDKEYVATASIWHKKIQMWGITPRIVGVYVRNDSNHILYDYRKAYAFIQLSKTI